MEQDTEQYGMIPPFDPTTGNLPPGVHQTEWAELVARFGTNPRRLQLLAGLRRAAENLRSAGCVMLYLDGSFVTTKSEPGDFDGCWDPHGVDPTKLDPVLLDYSHGRLAQKIKYAGELFIANVVEGVSGRTFLDFFQTDPTTGGAKGILVLDLRRL